MPLNFIFNQFRCDRIAKHPYLLTTSKDEIKKAPASWQGFFLYVTSSQPRG